MSSAFSIALSSLKAESAAINTTGNNLANMNTSGFKGSAVDFKDLFSESLGGGGSFDSGLGVSLPVNNQLFTQGAIQTSSAPLSAAIQGDGFFIVDSKANQQLFTRDGNFALDAQGVLRTQTGEAVQGWTAGPNGINTSGVAGDIVLPTGSVLPPTPTTTFSLNANLNSAGVAGTASGTGAFPMQVVDSLGNTHDLTVTFTRVAGTPSDWNYDVTIPGADVGLAAGTQKSVLPVPPGPGTITFNPDGTLKNPAAPGVPPAITVNIGGLADGALPVNMNWSLFDANGAGLLTSYAEKSSLTSSTQNGNTASELTSVGIQSGGQVVATYSNGQTKVEAQLALAQIQNPTSLSNVGNNNFAVGADTSTPAIGAPQTGGRGQILGGAVESSNVDMATEFTNLIVYQSAYQASSRVISTEQTLDQDLLQLIH
jgi:flagellar hook protein FlgE